MDGEEFKNTINVFTDGSYHRSTGLGGWAFCFQHKGRIIVRYGHCASPTSNNKAELLGPIMFLREFGAIKGLTFNIWSDSVYVVNSMEHWIEGWKSSGRLQPTHPKSVKNIAYIKEMDKLATKHGDTHFHWVKGHAGNRMNEVADVYAGEGSKRSVSKVGTDPDYDVKYVEEYNLPGNNIFGVL